MQALRDGGQRDERVPVVRRGIHHRIEIGYIERFAEIREQLAVCVAVMLVDLRLGGLRAAAVHIAHRHHADSGHSQQGRQIGVIAMPAGADHREVDFLRRRALTEQPRRNDEGHGGGSQILDRVTTGDSGLGHEGSEFTGDLVPDQ